MDPILAKGYAREYLHKRYDPNRGYMAGDEMLFGTVENRERLFNGKLLRASGIRKMIKAIERNVARAPEAVHFHKERHRDFYHTSYLGLSLPIKDVEPWLNPNTGRVVSDEPVHQLMLTMMTQEGPQRGLFLNADAPIFVNLHFMARLFQRSHPDNTPSYTLIQTLISEAATTSLLYILARLVNPALRSTYSALLPISDDLVVSVVQISSTQFKGIDSKVYGYRFNYDDEILPATERAIRRWGHLFTVGGNELGNGVYLLRTVLTSEMLDDQQRDYLAAFREWRTNFSEDAWYALMLDAFPGAFGLLSSVLRPIAESFNKLLEEQGACHDLFRHRSGSATSRTFSLDWEEGQRSSVQTAFDRLRS